MPAHTTVFSSTWRHHSKLWASKTRSKSTCCLQDSQEASSLSFQTRLSSSRLALKWSALTSMLEFLTLENKLSLRKVIEGSSPGSAFRWSGTFPFLACFTLCTIVSEHSTQCCWWMATPSGAELLTWLCSRHWVRGQLTLLAAFWPTQLTWSGQESTSSTTTRKSRSSIVDYMTQ